MIVKVTKFIGQMVGVRHMSGPAMKFSLDDWCYIERLKQLAWSRNGWYTYIVVVVMFVNNIGWLADLNHWYVEGEYGESCHNDMCLMLGWLVGRDGDSVCPMLDWLAEYNLLFALFEFKLPQCSLLHPVSCTDRAFHAFQLPGLEMIFLSLNDTPHPLGYYRWN